MKMKKTANMPYTNKDGSKGVHRIVSVVEFEGYSWKTIEVLEESGRPEWAGDPMGIIGGVAPMFLNNARVMKSMGFEPI